MNYLINVGNIIYGNLFMHSCERLPFLGGGGKTGARFLGGFAYLVRYIGPNIDFMSGMP